MGNESTGKLKLAVLAKMKADEADEAMLTALEGGASIPYLIEVTNRHHETIRRMIVRARIKRSRYKVFNTDMEEFED